MRRSFPGYYRPTEAEFSSIWENATFAFDTNVLFNFYRYKPGTRDKLFAVLQELRNRIWLPYQVGFEYHRGRAGVVLEQRAAFDAVTDALDKALSALKTVSQRYAKHSTLDLSEVVGRFGALMGETKSAIAKEKSLHVDLLHDDEIRDRLTTLFDGRVGRPLTDQQEKEAEQRLKAGRPPGYKDRKKAEGRGDPLGDTRIWLQLLGLARERPQQAIIFVTDDEKEDWWLRAGGQTLGPRPELIGEMAELETVFYLYSTSRFLGGAEQMLGLTGTADARKDIEAVAREAAAMRSVPECDPLTGLANRRQIHFATSAALAHAKRTGDPVTVLLLDIDHIKHLNDLQGHQVGDAVLKEIADVLLGTVGEAGTVGRYGGDEFLICLPNANESQGRTLAELLRLRVAEHRIRTPDAPPVGVTVSIGVSGYYDGEVPTADEVIADADFWLFYAKRQGNNRVEGGKPGSI